MLKIQKNKKSEAGFTLVEIAIVLIIIIFHRSVDRRHYQRTGDD
ncbi:prepilin-type N-terminal cleavage/methylation domain-containing protein [Thermodesulfobacteriota bacterium]